MTLTLHSLGAALAASGLPDWPYQKPGSAGAGYSSKKLRTPKWEPVFDMAKSTVAMPCNYTGFYDLDVLAGFGYLQFDWSNNKDVWVQDKPMTVTDSIAEQAALAHAKFPDTKIGVYRNGQLLLLPTILLLLLLRAPHHSPALPLLLLPMHWHHCLAPSRWSYM
eukprot:SAG11_NODE_478_length_9117_cov_6.916168_11_plen_164_part_00